MTFPPDDLSPHCAVATPPETPQMNVTEDPTVADTLDPAYGDANVIAPWTEKGNLTKWSTATVVNLLIIQKLSFENKIVLRASGKILSKEISKNRKWNIHTVVN